MMTRSHYILPFLVFMGWLAFTLFSGNYSEVTIVNADTAVVTKASVTLSKTTHSIGPLKSGEKQKLRFPVYGDDSYVVVAEFENGERIQDNIGYVTSGMNFNEIISISHKKITITTNDQ